MSIEMALYWNETLTDDLQLFFKRRLKNNDLAADLTQETYLRFHNWLKEGPPDNARALAFSIAVNLATDYQRKAKVRSQYHADIEPGLLAETQASAAPGPEQIVISHERLKLFHAALDELPALYRSTFLLHNIDGMTYPEVAACLGISESTVYKYLSKTISHCLKRLEEQD
jgi:RNA polymerase sigma factor (sigma-70 family)